MKISGIYAPIPTPFSDEKIAYDKLELNLQKWSATSLSGLVVLGSNGEFVFLDEQEKMDLVACVCRHVSGKMKVIAGTGAETTRETVRLTQKVADIGADAALVINPHYYKASMDEEALKRFYITVADNSPIPVLIYNMPGNTGINLPPKLVIELANHPNIIGIKDSSANIVQITEIAASTPDSFAIFAGSGSFLLSALAVGAHGGTLAVANILPDECTRIYTCFKEGNLEEARRLQYKIMAINKAVTTTWGVAGLKAAMDMLGYFGGDPRPPVLPLDQKQREALGKILHEALRP